MAINKFNGLDFNGMVTYLVVEWVSLFADVNGELFESVESQNLHNLGHNQFVLWLTSNTNTTDEGMKR